MNYELFTYQHLFDQALNIDQTTTTNKQELQSDIEMESERILIALQNNTAQMDPLKMQQYIKQHQHAIQITIHKLEDSISVQSEDDDKKAINKFFLNCSEKLILDLQKYFPSYFDYQETIPALLSKKTKAKIDEKASSLVKILSERKNPKQPISNLEDILKEILTAHKNINYGQQFYMDYMLDALTEQFQRIESGLEILDITLQIVSLNYNHPLFYEFCCTYFSKEVERCEEISAQYTTLNFIKKCINQTTSFTVLNYNPHLPSIRDSLLKFISAELDYLNAMDNIGAHLHQHGLLDDRYKVTLTVRQLAIFIHLQVEANIIITETPKLLHEYIAKHYRTNETDRISAKSFKNAYYSASTEDLEKVIDKIVTMLSLAQEKL